jgi:hypothetical protein
MVTLPAFLQSKWLHAGRLGGLLFRVAVSAVAVSAAATAAVAAWHWPASVPGRPALSTGLRKYQYHATVLPVRLDLPT